MVTKELCEVLEEELLEVVEKKIKIQPGIL